LQLERNVADFIQEDLFVTEKFALQEVHGDRRAVQLEKGQFRRALWA
jgi:hypothetical protein